MLAGATSPCCSVVGERRQAAAAREKALADEANEQRRANTRVKALADKADE